MLVHDSDASVYTCSFCARGQICFIYMLDLLNYESNLMLFLCEYLLLCALVCSMRLIFIQNILTNHMIAFEFFKYHPMKCEDLYLIMRPAAEWIKCRKNILKSCSSSFIRTKDTLCPIVIGLSGQSGKTSRSLYMCKYWPMLCLPELHSTFIWARI